MNTEVWCQSCEDYCNSPYGDPDAPAAVCPDCVRCGCGERMLEHNIEPGQHWNVNGKCWDPMCWSAAQSEERTRREAARAHLKLVISRELVAGNSALACVADVGSSENATGTKGKAK